MGEEKLSLSCLVNLIKEAILELNQFRFGVPDSNIYCTSINVFRVSPRFNLPLGCIEIREDSDRINYLLFRSMSAAEQIEKIVTKSLNEAGLNLAFCIVADL